MNSLTLVIYFADVIPSIRAMCVAMALIATIVFGVWAIGAAMHNDTEARRIRLGEVEKATTPPYKRFVSAIILLVFIAVVLPSRQTFLLMAGSQFGEAIVTSPEAKELFIGIKELIQGQLEELKK